MVRFDTRPMPRRGVGDWPFDDPVGYGNDIVYAGGANNGVEDAGIFGTISDFAQGGVQNLGELSNFLVRSGYTIEVVRNALNNIRGVNAPAPVVDYARQELAYLNNHPGAQQQNNTGLLIAAGVGLLLLVMLTRDNR